MDFETKSAIVTRAFGMYIMIPEDIQEFSPKYARVYQEIGIMFSDNTQWAGTKKDLQELLMPTPVDYEIQFALCYKNYCESVEKVMPLEVFEAGFKAALKIVNK